MRVQFGTLLADIGLVNLPNIFQVQIMVDVHVFF